MKILYITAKFPNIIQPWFLNTVLQAKKHGMHVKVATLQDGDESLVSELTKYGLNKAVIRAYIGRNNFFSALKNNFSPGFIKSTIQGISKCNLAGNIGLKKIIRCLMLAPYMADMEIDIIHSHSEPAGYSLLPVILAQKKPFVITFHGLPPPGVPQLTRQMRRQYTEAAGLILLNTKFAKKQYVSLGVDPSKIRILPQGTDLTRFTYVSKRYPKDGLVKILTVGRLSRDKGHIYALKAIRELVLSGQRISYMIVGQGPEKNNLIELINKYKLNKYVSIKSGITEDELIEAYHEAHIFLLPSIKSLDGFHEETQGVVIQEAQACGVLVIATNVGGIPECVDDGVNAFLVPDKDSTAIVEKVKWLIENNKKWCDWQVTARKHVEEKYDISAIGKKLVTIYQSVVDGDI